MKTKSVTKIVGFQSGHDVSYCILENGIPTLHEEQERITRAKMEIGDGLKFFFSRSNDENIKYFAFGNWGVRTHRYNDDKERNNKACNDKMNQIINKNRGKFYQFGHHLTHAANAFYTSNFDRALIITVDGGGWEEGYDWTALCIHEGTGNKVRRIKVFDPKEVNIGKVYTFATRHIFRLSTGYPKGNQAGTVMAMAALGEAKYTDLFSNVFDNLSKLRRIVKLSEQEKFNVAASLQKYSEEIFLKSVKKYIVESGYENLCLSGGVSLNCVMVGKLKKWFPKVKDIFCDPVPYDGGLSLGAARYLWHHVLDNPRIKNEVKNVSPYLGKIYTKKVVEEALNLFRNKIKFVKATDEDVLDKISQQKIVAVFGGGSESGRRALGNRSILADPRNADMKDYINNNVKHREWFRPLAPSILEEKVGEWFEDPILSPYMSFALKFKEKTKNKVPAVIHFDGTARLQTVSKHLSPWYHGFISKWNQLSGVPILLNTSFNDSEPIVETPQDALRCFLNTNIDYLYFFDYGIMVAKS